MSEKIDTPIVAYKGFNKDMTSHNHFQYKEGESYHTDSVKICCSGFHACEQPLFVFSYYPPETSVYHRVELSGTIDRWDGKLCASDITIKEEVSLVEMINIGLNKKATFIGAPVSYNSNIYPCAGGNGYRLVAVADGEDGTAITTNTGSCSVAVENNSAAITFGVRSVAATNSSESIAAGLASSDYVEAIGGHSIAAALSTHSIAKAEEEESVAIVNRSTSEAIVQKPQSIAIAYAGVAHAESPNSIAIAVNGGYATGVIGSYLVLSDNFDKVITLYVDGETILANKYYTLIDGKVELIDGI